MTYLYVIVAVVFVIIAIFLAGRKAGKDGSDAKVARQKNRSMAKANWIRNAPRSDSQRKRLRNIRW